MNTQHPGPVHVLSAVCLLSLGAYIYEWILPTLTHTHTSVRSQHTDLDELSCWLPPFLKVFLTMLLLYLESQP